MSSLNAINVGAPWLFWEKFSQLPDSKLTTLAEAGAFSGLSYILLDHLVDGQAADSGTTVLLQQVFHEQANGRLFSLFAADHPFWSTFDRLSSRLRAALATELDMQRDTRQLSLETFRLTAEGKVAPATITLAAAAHLLDDPDLASRAEATLAETIAAGQLGHDVSDWRADLAAGHLTYFLSRCAPLEAWLAPQWPTEEEVEQTLAVSWLDVDHYKLASNWLTLAQQHGTPLGCAGWERYLDHYTGVAQQSTTHAIARHLEKKLT